MSIWKEWYTRKGYSVEADIPYISKILKKNSRILDLGCGHGRHILYYAAKGHELYGADNDEPTLRELKKKLKKSKLSAKLRNLDITKKLPYPTGYFDLVIATRSIHHTKNKDVKTIFDEISRILKRGGILFFQAPGYEGVEKSVKTREMYGKPVALKWIEPHTYTPLSGPEKGVPHHSFSKKEIQILLKNYRMLKFHSLKTHYDGYCVIAKKK